MLSPPLQFSSGGPLVTLTFPPLSFRVSWKFLLIWAYVLSFLTGAALMLVGWINLNHKRWVGVTYVFSQFTRDNSWPLCSSCYSSLLSVWKDTVNVDEWAASTHFIRKSTRSRKSSLRRQPWKCYSISYDSWHSVLCLYVARHDAPVGCRSSPPAYSWPRLTVRVI